MEYTIGPGMRPLTFEVVFAPALTEPGTQRPDYRGRVFRQLDAHLGVHDMRELSEGVRIFDVDVVAETIFQWYQDLWADADGVSSWVDQETDAVVADASWDVCKVLLLPKRPGACSPASTRWAAEKCATWGRGMVLLQADLTRAFDRLHHSAILRALRRRAVAEEVDKAAPLKIFGCRVNMVADGHQDFEVRVQAAWQEMARRAMGWFPDMRMGVEEPAAASSRRAPGTVGGQHLAVVLAMWPLVDRLRSWCCWQTVMLVRRGA